ncbi:MAG: OmpA family protein [Ignavibacteriae bacterium]|nr:OmpA family protein [Ignavibacteriota bacterium]
MKKLLLFLFLIPMWFSYGQGNEETNIGDLRDQIIKQLEGLHETVKNETKADSKSNPSESYGGMMRIMNADCIKEAVEFSLEKFLGTIETADINEVQIATMSKVAKLLQFIKNDSLIDNIQYIRDIVECDQFCSPLIAHLSSCYAVAVANTKHEFIFFPTGSDIVPSKYSSIIDTYSNILKSDRTKRIALFGNASRVGEKQFNRNLSGRRATSVLNKFVANGIPRERISMTWFGWEPPKINKEVASRWSLNEEYRKFGEQMINQNVIVVIYGSK